MSIFNNIFDLNKDITLSSRNPLNVSSTFQRNVYQQEFIGNINNVIFNNKRSEIPFNQRQKENIFPSKTNKTPSKELNREFIYNSEINKEREPKDSITNDKKLIFKSFKQNINYSNILKPKDKNSNSFLERVPTDKVKNYYKRDNNQKKDLKLIKFENSGTNSIEKINKSLNQEKKISMNYIPKENFSSRNTKNLSLSINPLDNKFHIKTMKKSPTDKARINFNINGNIGQLFLKSNNNTQFNSIINFNQSTEENKEKIPKNRVVKKNENNKKIDSEKQTKYYENIINLPKINIINKSLIYIKKSKKPENKKLIKISNTNINTNNTYQDKFLINESLKKIIFNSSMSNDEKTFIKRKDISNESKINKNSLFDDILNYENNYKILNKSGNIEDLAKNNKVIKNKKKIFESMNKKNIITERQKNEKLINNNKEGLININKIKFNKKIVKVEQIKKNIDDMKKLKEIIKLKENKNGEKFILENKKEYKMDKIIQNNENDINTITDKIKEENNLNNKKDEKTSLNNVSKNNEQLIKNKIVEIKIDNINNNINLINPQINITKEEKPIKNNEEIKVIEENKEITQTTYEEKKNNNNKINNNKLEEIEKTNKNFLMKIQNKEIEQHKKNKSPVDKIKKGKIKKITEENELQIKKQKINEAKNINKKINEEEEEKNNEKKINNYIIKEKLDIINSIKNNQENENERNVNKNKEENKNVNILNNDLNFYQNINENNLLEKKKKKLEKIKSNKGDDIQPILIEEKQIEKNNDNKYVFNSEFEKKNIQNNLEPTNKLNYPQKNEKNFDNKINNNEINIEKMEIIDEEKKKEIITNKYNSYNPNNKIDNLNLNNINLIQSEIKEEIPRITQPKKNLSQSHIISNTQIEKLNNYDKMNAQREKQESLIPKDKTNISVNKILKNSKENNIKDNNKNKEKTDISKSVKLIEIEDKKILNKSLENDILRKLRENFNLHQKTEEHFNPNDFKYLQVLGEGEFGKIYLVQSIKDYNQYYAIKKEEYTSIEEVKKSQMATKMVKNYLKSTNSQGVIKIYDDFCQIKDNLYNYFVLMETADRDMEQELIIRCNQNHFYTEEELINVLCQLIITFAELQKYGIAHRDIKPQNILIKKGRYKISDFGEAIILNNNGDLVQSLTGTELYMSPILFFGMKQKSEKIKHNAYKSDVFSLGLCILLAGTLNYDSLVEIREITDMNKIKEIVMYYLSVRYSPLFISFIFKMLEINEENRPDFLQLRNMLVKKR